MKRLRKLTGPYYSIIVFFMVVLLFLSMSRLGLLLLYHSRIPDLASFIKTLVFGIRIDVVLAVYCVSLPVLLAPFLEGYKFTASIFRVFISVWFTIWGVIIAVMETITPGYINEYDVRPNRLFVEFLAYPKEVVSMLLKGYLTHACLGLLAIFLTTYAVYRLCKVLTREPSTWHPASKMALLPFLVVLLFLGGRSSLGHRPVNPSNVAFSTDPLINDLALNSSYSLLYAVYRMKDEGDAAKVYGRMDMETMVDQVRKSMALTDARFENPKIPTMHRLNARTQRDKPMNLVIILEESLGAEFVSSLGGLPLTPNLEKLSHEGWWFDQLYATGTRSVRGIEAVVAGFLPTPGRSVVKLGNSQKNFFTIAQVLAQRGYMTRFIYGGDSNFDNMKKFFLGNGFKEVIDETDYVNPFFKGSWGVSDQDLFSRTHELSSQSKDQPFFTLVFSSSNHTPFEFPDNTIDLYEQPKNTVHNAVKYADYALGEFFEKAKTSSYWDNTIFLVVADHNSRVGGESLVPIDRFKIPALIMGPGVSPGIYSHMASQIDLPTTLLSLMGISCDSPMAGRDLTRNPDEFEGRAILQFYKNQAYMIGDQVTLLQPGERIDQFIFKDHHLIPAKSNEAMGKTALAHALWASWAYKNQGYNYDSESDK
ncbi:MAG: LTA synthase family protein [Proteobacteria bacterium]|nr:LTA synthase family protein [Pseudomonadota bacterium]